MPTTHSIEIKNFSYRPRTLEIAPGDTVEWENKDGAAHTVTDEAGTFDSGDLLEGGKFSRTFDTGAATIKYKCRHHQGMRGTLTVSHQVRIVSAEGDSFDPKVLVVEPGDAVVWTNEAKSVHTATASPGQSVTFDTGDIEPSHTSRPHVFEKSTNQSGLDYYSRHQPTMEGRIFVRAIVRATRSSRRDGLRTFPVEDWRLMAKIVCAAWVQDMADDFIFARNVHRAEDNEAVKRAFEEIERWWRELLGDPQAKISDRDTLLAQPRERLEVLGRSLRLARRKLQPLVFRSPLPNRPDDIGGPGVLYPGQSADPFGKAITVNHASDEIQRIEPLEEIMAAAAENIELLMDAGETVPAKDMEAYAQAKADVLPEHYLILADHQFSGLTKLFGKEEFDETQFLDGIWRMTVRGEWDGPRFVCWHWMRWIQMYLEVLETGTVPDMFRPMPPL